MKPHHVKRKTKKVPKGLPAWIKAIPESRGHGSGTYQKRLWRLVSDFVRIRDWYEFGTCVATSVRIEHWKEGDAGHYKSYSSCNGMFKFEEINIHLQSSNSNAWGGMDIGHSFGKELRKRYGENIIWEINCVNNLYQGDKPTTTKVIEKMREILKKMKNQPEQPAYYERVISLQ